MPIDEGSLDPLGILVSSCLWGTSWRNEGEDFAREVAAFVYQTAPEDAGLSPSLICFVESEHDEDAHDGG